MGGGQGAAQHPTVLEIVPPTGKNDLTQNVNGSQAEKV